jgi:adenosylcobinamide hydrolase
MSLLRQWSDRTGHSEAGTGAGSIIRPVLVQSFPAGWRAVSTAIVGGGIGPLAWWLNAQVSRSYSHPDPVAHTVEIAAGLGLDTSTRGVAMLTAADPSRFTTACDEGVEVVATVGLGLPVPAAAADEVAWVPATSAEPAHQVGTINLLVIVPVALSDAALVNAVVTATEAKTQALVEAGVPGTGTSSDAVCIVCPDLAQPFGADGSPAAPVPEAYGGPRSLWGARLARAVHVAVAAGTADWVAVHPPGDEHRRWGESWPRRPTTSRGAG